MRHRSASWLPDGYSQIFRSYVFGPRGFWTMAPLRYAAKFDPFLSLDYPSHALRPGAIQGKKRIKFCHLATLVTEFYPDATTALAISDKIFEMGFDTELKSAAEKGTSSSSSRKVLIKCLFPSHLQGDPSS